jgi:hypothetical protein
MSLAVVTKATAVPSAFTVTLGFVSEAHAQGDIVDRVVSIFADSFHTALDLRARGAALPHETEAAYGAAASEAAG